MVGAAATVVASDCWAVGGGLVGALVGGGLVGATTALVASAVVGAAACSVLSGAELPPLGVLEAAAAVGAGLTSSF